MVEVELETSQLSLQVNRVPKENLVKKFADFKVTWIGRDFDAPYPGPFDPGYMKALYQYGYDLMKAGEAWENKPLMLMNDEERRRSPRTGARAPAS